MALLISTVVFGTPDSNDAAAPVASNRDAHKIRTDRWSVWSCHRAHMARMAGRLRVRRPLPRDSVCDGSGCSRDAAHLHRCACGPAQNVKQAEKVARYAPLAASRLTSVSYSASSSSPYSLPAYVPVYRLILSSRFPRDGRSATMKAPASSLHHAPIPNPNKQSNKTGRLIRPGTNLLPSSMMSLDRPICRRRPPKPGNELNIHMDRAAATRLITAYRGRCMRAILLRLGITVSASGKVLNPRNDSPATHRC